MIIPTIWASALKRTFSVILITALLSNVVFAGTFYVDINGDTDPNTCVEDESDNDNDCTFRDAVSQLSAGDTVRFLENMVITNSGTDYDINADSVTIDGSTGGYAVELNGNGVSADGLRVNGEGATIDGLYIYGFDGGALNSGIQVHNDNATIQNNVIGLRSDNSTVDANGAGIRLAEGSNAVIDSNTISGSASWGIEVAVGVADVVIKGNKIGTNPDGTTAKGNGYGVYIQTTSFNGGYGGQEGITIGGPTAAERNIISGNTNSGISITPVTSATGTLNIQNNYIGVGANGTTQIANGEHGIFSMDDVLNGVDWTVTDNVISGNGGGGVHILSGDDVSVSGNYIGLDASGSGDIGNDGGGVWIGDSGAITLNNNIIGNNGDGDIEQAGGVYILNGTSLVMQGNNIGVNVDGTAAAGNANDGAIINGASMTSVTIGTDGDGSNDMDESNVFAAVSGTDKYGLIVEGVATDAVVNIKGNYFGITPAGLTSSALGLGTGGSVNIETAGTLNFGGDNELGVSGTGALGEGNVVANGTGACLVLGSEVVTASIYGNIFGLKRGAGGVFDTAASNSSSTGCVYVNSPVATTVNIGSSDGDTVTSRRNIISSDSAGSGIMITATANEATVNIDNNYIGTDYLGTADRGNTINGIAVLSNVSPSVSIHDNVISGNTGSGVMVFAGGGGSPLIDFLGNTIGLNAAGSAALANGQMGITVATGGGTPTVYVGDGTVSGRNVISGNGWGGIILNPGATTTINGNYIGTNVGGNSAIGNGSATPPHPTGIGFNGGGIEIHGGTTVVEDNVISGNSGQAILVEGADSLTITENKIGVDATGASALPNTRADDTYDFFDDGVSDFSGAGIILRDSGMAAVGGAPEQNLTIDEVKINGNVIAGNEGPGIVITHDSTADGGGGGQAWSAVSYIKNNYIGFLADSSELANGGSYEVYVNPNGGTLTNFSLGDSANKNKINNAAHTGVYMVDVIAANFLSGSSLGDIDDDNTLADTVCPIPYNYLENWVSSVLSLRSPLASLCSEEEEEEEVVVVVSSGSSGGGGTVTTTEVAIETETETETETKAETKVSTTETKISTTETKTPKKETTVLEDVAETIVKTIEGEFVQGVEVVDADKAESAIQNYEKIKEVKALEVEPESQEEKEKVAKKTLIEEVIKGEKDKVKVEKVKKIVKEAVSESLEEKLREKKLAVGAGGKVELHLKDKIIEVEDVNDIEWVVAVGEKKDSRAFKEELNEREKEAGRQGKRVIVIDEESNLDDDDVADAYQIKNDLPLFDSDPDNDGISTIDEIYLGLDPKVADVPKLKVTNVENKRVGNQPSLRVAGRAGTIADVIVIPKEGRERIISLKRRLLASLLFAEAIEGISPSTEQIYLGRTVIDAGGKGEVTPTVALDDGDYYVVVDDGTGAVGEVSSFTVDSDQMIDTPEVEFTEVEYALGGTVEWNLDLVGRLISVFDVDDFVNEFIGAETNMQFIEGEADPGATLFVTWKSLLRSSVVLADASQGTFKLNVPNDLPAGNHEILVYAFDESRNLVSNVVTLLFMRR